ncbi:hypothetical protein [Pseudomonas sp. TMP25]|uniref:hypothetical protein n=1 Tax=Pseudomonas sp. TMP25 TaxID=3136561 RepID=UPI0031017A46
MRRHYTINSHTCHFHESPQGILHEVDDLLSLINLPGSSKKQLIEKWHTKLCLSKETKQESNEKASTQYLVISEKLLPALLRDAQAQRPERSLIDIKALVSRILQERLDAIVQNHTPHLTHADADARLQMLYASEAGFSVLVQHMNFYEKKGILTPEKASEWHRIKGLLSCINNHVNERHFYALLTLAAPIWPENSLPKFKTTLEKKSNFSVYILIEIAKSDKMSNIEKPYFIQDAIRQIGAMHEKKHPKNNDNPEP